MFKWGRRVRYAERQTPTVVSHISLWNRRLVILEQGGGLWGVCVLKSCLCSSVPTTNTGILRRFPGLHWDQAGRAPWWPQRKAVPSHPRPTIGTNISELHLESDPFPIAAELKKPRTTHLAFLLHCTTATGMYSSRCLTACLVKYLHSSH